MHNDNTFRALRLGRSYLPMPGGGFTWHDMPPEASPRPQTEPEYGDA